MSNRSSEKIRVLHDLEVFHEIARALTSSLDLDCILATIMRQMQRFFRPETWTLLLTDENKRELYYAIADGQYGSHLVRGPVPFGAGMAGCVAERGESLIVNHSQSSGQFQLAAANELPFDVHSTLCIPLRSRLRTLGVIQLFNCPKETFSEYSIAYLRVLCDYAAIAIENAHAYEKVQELTITDELTGLYNLRHFYGSLDAEISRCDCSGSDLGLIFIDLDRFKLVNDKYGHQAGSNLLTKVANTIRAHVRAADLVFRYGGDEFIVILPGTTKEITGQVARRLLNRIRHTTHKIAKGTAVNVRASFGVASYPADGSSAEEVLRMADSRMYAVKNTTRDGVAVDGAHGALNRSA